MSGDRIPQGDALRLQLAAIAGRETDKLIEVRWDAGARWPQEWYSVTDPEGIRRAIIARAHAHNVYIGAAPRTRRGGTKGDVDRAWVLWADCDTPEAVEALRRFRPAPSIVIQTSEAHKLHAYWTLREPAVADDVKRANRRLAHALGADMASTDRARVLRPAGSLNHKTDPPRPVVCIRLELDVYQPLEVVGALPDPEAERPHSPIRPGEVGDALHAIPATDYVPALLGRPLGRNGKTECPFHDDGVEDPGGCLHAYPGDRGWACFDCGRGGTMIDLGGYLFGIEPRGSGFHEIRRRLAAELLRHIEQEAA